MPKVNVYLPEQLADSVRDLQIPLSEVCQRALDIEVARRSSTAVSSGNLLDAGFPFPAPHKCQPPPVNTTTRPWTVGDRPVGVTAKWKCAECPVTWALGFDGKWSVDLSPIFGAVFDMFRASSRPTRTARASILRPSRGAPPS